MLFSYISEYDAPDLVNPHNRLSGPSAGRQNLSIIFREYFKKEILIIYFKKINIDNFARKGFLGLSLAQILISSH
jgi:hypothetical protein